MTRKLVTYTNAGSNMLTDRFASGTVKPQSTCSTLIDTDPTGTWGLRVCDTAAGDPLEFYRWLLVINEATLTGDPHSVGFNGVQYDLVGDARTWYTVVSDASFVLQTFVEPLGNPAHG